MELKLIKTKEAIVKTYICFILILLVTSLLYSQGLEKESQFRNFKNKYPDEFSIQWDKASGGPKKIIGNNIFLKSHSVTKTNIQALTKDFINENVDLLNIRNTELELENKFIITY